MRNVIPSQRNRSSATYQTEHGPVTMAPAGSFTYYATNATGERIARVMVDYAGAPTLYRVLGSDARCDTLAECAAIIAAGPRD